MRVLYDDNLLKRIPDVDARLAAFAPLSLPERECWSKTAGRRQGQRNGNCACWSRVGIPAGHAHGTDAQGKLPPRSTVPLQKAHSDHERQLERCEEMADEVYAMSRIARRELDLLPPEEVREGQGISEEARKSLERHHQLLSENVSALGEMIRGTGDEGPIVTTTNESLKGMFEENLKLVPPGQQPQPAAEQSSRVRSRVRSRPRPPARRRYGCRATKPAAEVAPPVPGPAMPDTPAPRSAEVEPARRSSRQRNGGGCSEIQVFTGRPFRQRPDTLREKRDS